MTDARYPVLDINDPPPPYPFADGAYPAQPTVHSFPPPPPPSAPSSSSHNANPIPLKQQQAAPEYPKTVETQTVHTQQQTVLVIPSVSSHRQQQTVCPHCGGHVTTITRRERGGCQHCWAIILCCMIGCPFCLIPYCCDDECGDTVHTCPNCEMDLGVVKRL